MSAEMDIHTVLDFWFLEPESGQRDQPRPKLWFGGGPALDQSLREQFEATLLAAALGAYSDWQQTPQGSLALILLFDQMPRNIYRGSARAFEFSEQALDICRQGLDRQYADSLSVTERVFFYMPLVHAESVSDQQLSVALFSELEQQAPPALKDFAAKTLDSAREHQTIIVRFGRYPHRNQVLRRQSTEEEVIWLAENSKRFGQ